METVGRESSRDSLGNTSCKEHGTKEYAATAGNDEFLTRVRFDISYDGTLFHGWAAQPDLRTVEGVVESACRIVFQSPIAFTVAGRTDAGVHASHQVAHADIPSRQWRKAVRNGTSNLAHRITSLLAREYSLLVGEHAIRVPRGTCDVIVTAVEAVSAEFDARFSATGRHYEYILASVPYAPPRDRGHVYAVSGGPLVLDAMNEGAQMLCGEHDFLSFCHPREGATTIRTLKEFYFSQCDDGREYTVAHVHADAFCHSMVRSLIGACIEVGQGRKNPAWCAFLVNNPSRKNGVPIAPAHGLTLVGVDYPPENEWALRAQKARNRRGTCC